MQRTADARLAFKEKTPRQWSGALWTQPGAGRSVAHRLPLLVPRGGQQLFCLGLFGNYINTAPAKTRPKGRQDGQKANATRISEILWAWLVLLPALEGGSLHVVLYPFPDGSSEAGRVVTDFSGVVSCEVLLPLLMCPSILHMGVAKQPWASVWASAATLQGSKTEIKRAEKGCM